MYEPEDRLLRMLLAEELRIANKHLPVQRRSLKELLSMEYPHVVLRDGSIHFFRKRELLELAKYVTDTEAERLMLPIVVVMRPDLGEGTAVIQDEVGAIVVARILGIEPRSPLYIYRPHVARLRELFDTVVQVAILPSMGGEPHGERI